MRFISPSPKTTAVFVPVGVTLLLFAASFALLAAIGLAHDTGSHSTSAPSVKKHRGSGLPSDPRRVGREMATLRTRNSRTYAGRRGLRVTRVFPNSIHYRTRRGSWAPIDSRLRRQGARFVNRAGSYSTALPVELGERPVRVRRGPWFVDFSLRGARAQARVTRNEARYVGALSGTDVIYEAQNDAVKESIVLRSPRSDRRLAFDLSMSAGLRPKLRRSKGLSLVDRRGRTRLFIAAPFMFDTRGARSTDVAIRLVNVAGRWRLSLQPDSKWLEAPDRAWPVTVDPYVYTEGDRDCGLDESQPSMCGWDRLVTGYGHSAQHKSVVRFDLDGRGCPRNCV